MSERRLLTGWGRTAPSLSTVTRLSAEGVPAAIRGAGRRGVLVRGLGRSYGDAAQNAGGDILVLEDGPPIRLDTGAATVRVGGGTSIDQLIRCLLPHGFFVSVTPGTRFVTVGGAIAADIHGKNHHRHGSLGHHVVEMDLVDAQGRRSTLTPHATPELFWATVGGMGLTGVIVSAVLRVLPVETAYMRVDTDRVANLPDLLAMMSATDDRYTYSVAWIDLLARGKALGRSVLTRGEHAAVTDLPEDRQREPLRPAGSPRLSAPGWAPDRLMNHWSVKAFNELWFRKAPRQRRDEIQHLSSFFHPLDGVTGWNTLYGRRGLTQYQFVVPLEADAALTEAVRRIADAGHASFLAVLKRFGPGSPGMLSFPMPGWTLALDLPADPALAGLLNDLDELVVSAGGRVYLAKDSRTSAARIREMYPRLEEFRALRRRTDPERVFRSDLARRLDL